VLAAARTCRAEQDVRQRVGDGGPCRGRHGPRLSCCPALRPSRPSACPAFLPLPPQPCAV
jgi:hypothetical protein